MTRLQTSVSLGLGQGWQFFAQVPIDTKFLSIDYTTHDGEAYEPPYGNIHHRNETLFGLGDGRIEVQYFESIGSEWTAGAGFGLTVPLGRIEKDPYALAAESENHQHIQMGNGTVDPVFRASAIWSGHQWGALFLADGRLPLIHNAKGYRPSSSIQVSTGPTYRLNTKLRLTSNIALTRESQAEWSGEPDPMSGRTAITAGAGIIYRFTPMLATMLQGRTTLGQWSEEALIVQPFVGSIGLSWTPSGKGKAH